MIKLLGVLISAGALAMTVPQDVHVEAPVHVTAIDVIADVRDAHGKVPAGLTPADFVLLEEGVEQPVIGIEYLALPFQPQRPAEAAAPSPGPAAKHPDWQIVIYYDAQLTSIASRKRSAAALLKQVDSLVRAGKVDVIFASPTPTALVRGTRDPAAVEQALHKARSLIGANTFLAHRRDYTALEKEAMSQRLFHNEVPRPSTPTTERPAQHEYQAIRGGNFSALEANTVRPYVEEEIRMISRSRNHLVRWLATYPRNSPRLLFILSDGFDLDPLEFYASNLQRKAANDLRRDVEQSSIGQSLQSTTQALAAAGWLTVNLAGENTMGSTVSDASGSSMGRNRPSMTPQMEVRSGPQSLVFRPLDPLNVIAEGTAGTVVPHPAKLDEALAALNNRVKLTYQVSRAPDGKPRKIEIRPGREGVRVRAAQWASSSTPDHMAEARAVGLFTSDAAGDLPVEATVQWQETAGGRRKGMLFASAKKAALDALPGSGARVFRVTFAIQMPGQNAFVVNRIVSDGMTPEGFRYRTPLEIPAAAEVIVVTIEEIGSGAWGAARMKVPPTAG